MKVNHLFIKTVIYFFLLTIQGVLADSTKTDSVKTAVESPETNKESEKSASGSEVLKTQEKEESKKPSDESAAKTEDSSSSKTASDSKTNNTDSSKTNNADSPKTEGGSRNTTGSVKTGSTPKTGSGRTKKGEIGETNILDTLNGIIESSESLEKALAEKKKEYKNAGEESKKELLEEINQLNALLEVRKKEFESIATGSDMGSSFISSEKKFSLQEEIQEIIKPAIEELKRVTKRPREIEKLRRDISVYEKQLPIVQDALVKISELIKQTTDSKESKLKKRLKDIEIKWQNKEEEITREISKLKYQLEQKLESKTSIFKTLQFSLEEFFKTRGLHLFFAFMAFLFTYLLFRFIYWSLYKVKNTNPVEIHSFYYRLFQVAYHILAFVISIMAFLFVLYSLSDWVLLIIAVIVIIGILWTARHGFSLFWEQAKLLLNISTVREGERLIYHGVPWQIASLNLQTTLINPVLKGGLNRLPLTSLIGLQSRPFHANELWFPSREGDYVLLSDTTFGKVVMQTPEMVTIELRGGALKTYPCASFLEQNPINLSINSFTVYVTFGLDYSHQAIITCEVLEKVQSWLEQGIKQEDYAEHFLKVKAQFKEAAESSLNILILADFSGKAASEYQVIWRAIQRMLVDACNHYGWIIPFTQVTVHSMVHGSESEQPSEAYPLIQDKHEETADSMVNIVSLA